MADRRWWPTADELSVIVRAQLDAGNEDHAMRLLLDGINDLPGAAEAGKLDEALQEPRSTGDLRWDTLLAAAIRYRLNSLGARPPEWTWKAPLDRFWWPIDAGERRAGFDYATSPVELARVGIFMSERDFTQA
jgi:hypothetical protein